VEVGRGADQGHRAAAVAADRCQTGGRPQGQCAVADVEGDRQGSAGGIADADPADGLVYVLIGGLGSRHGDGRPGRQAEAGRGRGGVGPGAGAARGWPRARPLAGGVARGGPGALMAAGLPPMAADAPLDGGVNVTRPPATGSPGLLAVTVTTRGAEKAVETS